MQSNADVLTPEEVIELLDLEPLPIEGGYYRRTYYAAEQLPLSALPERYDSPHRFGGAIYYLLSDDPDCFSAMHVLLTEEIYHFYLGDPVELLLLYPDGQTDRVTLGSDLLNGQQVQYVVPRGVWQGSHLLPGGRWALLGTTMAPAYEDSDCVFGERESLAAQYPSEADLIRRLTRTAEGKKA
jgi:predicted cupin superfamily sugar epimerase